MAYSNCPIIPLIYHDSKHETKLMFNYYIKKKNTWKDINKKNIITLYIYVIVNILVGIMNKQINNKTNKQTKYLIII